MDTLSLEAIESAAQVAYQALQPTPQINWPLLSERCGCDVWVKHENTNPTGAFKVRGGLVYLHRLGMREPDCPGVITATRGNHGQSIALAAARNGIESVVVAPEGNSEDKNRAMAGLGCELILHGRDFDESVLHMSALAQERQLHRIPSFHPDLVAGVASYGLELFRARPDLDRVYVPVGLGSGICGLISARNALGLDVDIVGVVSTEAPAYKLSLEAGHCISTDSAETLADGMAVRVPNPGALDLMLGNVSHMVAVSDEEILRAMNIYFSDCHSLAEGAGAAPLAALLQERDQNRGKSVAVILTGSNVDARVFSRAMAIGS